MFGNLTAVKRYLTKKAEKLTVNVFDITNAQMNKINDSSTTLLITVNRIMNENPITLLVTDNDSILDTNTLDSDVLGGDEVNSVWTVSLDALATPGTYYVTLSATDSKGLTAERILEVTKS